MVLRDIKAQSAAAAAELHRSAAIARNPTVSDTCQISLAYRGVLRHRGVRISGDTYGKTWILRLANDMWTLTDHKGDEVHSFTQKGLHSKVAFPDSLPGNKDLCLLGLGQLIHCFQPEQEVLDALKHYVEQSERANAPQLASWHRVVGLGFLGFGVLCIAAGVAALASALQSDDVAGLPMRPVALALILSGLVVGGYFFVIGVRELLKASRFAKVAAASERPDS